MPDQGRLKKLKDLAMSLITPQPSKAQAEPSPLTSFTLQEMEKRKAALAQRGKKQTGGMFDVIYRGRKEREDALRELGF